MAGSGLPPGSPTLLIGGTAGGQSANEAPRYLRSTRFGRNICIRLESAECQPQLHAAHGGVALRRAAAFGFSQHHVARYVRNSLSPQFLSAGMPAWKTEHGVEFNVLMLSGPLLVQPVIQYYANVGGIGGALSLPDLGRRWTFKEEKRGVAGSRPPRTLRPLCSRAAETRRPSNRRNDGR